MRATLLGSRRCVTKNPKNAGVGRKIHFQAESYLFSPHEMAKHSSTGPGYWGRGTALISVQILLASGYSFKATRQPVTGVTPVIGPLH